MKRRPIDFARLRGLISPRIALDLIGWSPQWSRGPTLARGPCPYHGSAPGSRSLVVSDRVVYCHKCHWSSDAIGIWGWHTGLEVYDAAVDLCTRAMVEVPYLR